jgi:excisionase family DNA binding protein
VEQKQFSVARGRNDEFEGVAKYNATVKDAAEAFKVDPSTIRRWISQGVLSAVRIGKTTLRVDLSSLQVQPIIGRAA